MIRYTACIGILVFLSVANPCFAIEQTSIDTALLNISVKRLEALEIAMAVLGEIDKRLITITVSKKLSDVEYARQLNQMLSRFLQDEEQLINRPKEYDVRLRHFEAEIKTFKDSISPRPMPPGVLQLR